MSLEINFNRVDKVYHPGDRVSGTVTVDSPSSMSYNSIKLFVEGATTLQLSARSIGLFEAFYSSLKPMPIVSYEIEISAGGKVNAGITDFPFEFTLKPAAGVTEMHDTYHGVYVNIAYNVNAEMKKGMMGGSVKKSKEFIVENARDAELHAAAAKAKPFAFKVAPDSLQNVKESSRRKIPEFLFEGHLKHTNCYINEPFSGEINISKCAVDIKSIELQLVRVESCTYLEGEAREATEIQNIQIADGNVVRGLPIPIHMIFPRLFTCQTTSSKHFKVEFEVNLIILFADNHMVTENFPIKLFR